MTQQQRLLGYLYENKIINPLEAWENLGIYRLSAKVFDLRKLGYDIKTERLTVKNRYNEHCVVAQYRLESA